MLHFSQRDAIGEAGAIAAVVALVVDGDNTGKSNATCALYELATKNGTKLDTIREAGGIHVALLLVLAGRRRRQQTLRCLRACSIGRR